MWAARVPWSSLKQETRWTVELHASLEVPRLSSCYPTRRVDELVVERRENLTPLRWPDFLFCYLGLENVTGQTGMLDAFAPKLGRDVQSTSGVFRKGDILYGRLRPYLNKVYLAEGAVHTGICSGEFFVLTPRPDRIRAVFLRELLASSHIADAVKGMQFGSSLPRLQLKDLMKLAVPVPPLAAQEEIETSLLEERNRFRSYADAAKTGGAEIRKAFEAALADGAPLKVRNLATPIPTEAFPNALPSEHIATVRGRRSNNLALFG